MHGVSGKRSETAPNPTFTRRDLYGVAFWVLFSAVAVWLRGIRWDEHYELAQVVTGQIPYPEEHSIYGWTRYVRNLPIFLSSGLLHLFPGPEVVCFVRNVLWLLATILPVYLLTVLLTKRVLYGGVAVLFALLALHIEFDSNYPLYAWPAYFSNGHVGRGFALVTICLLLSGNWKFAFGLLGFLPVVHPGQAPLVYALAFARVGYVALRHRSFSAFRVTAWALPGLLLFIGLWSYAPLTVPLPQEGPYFSPDDPQAIAQAYIALHPHWALPGTIVSFVGSNFILAAMLLLVWGRIMTTDPRTSEHDESWKWLGLYLAGVGVAVWLTMLAHFTLKEDIPYTLLAWMPYRFTNHAATLFPAIVVALLSTLNREERWILKTGPFLLGGALIFESAKSLFNTFLSEDFYHRYFSTGEATAYGLIGATALLLLKGQSTRPRRIAWGTAVGTGTVAFAFFHQFGAFCIGAGAVTALMLSRVIKSEDSLPDDSHGKTKYGFLVVAMTITLVVLLGREWRDRETLPRSIFDRKVTLALHMRGDNTVMVVSHPDQHRLQVRIEHPVMLDAATASSIVYTPHLAPAIQKVLYDFYGIRYHPKNPADAPEWSVIWKTRTRPEWIELGETYAFRYVISPKVIPLDLDVVLQGDGETLYAIPLP